MKRQELMLGMFTLVILTSCGGGESQDSSAAAVSAPKCTPDRACVTTVAGSGDVGITDGAARAASFWLPYAVALDGSGGIDVADYAKRGYRTVGVDGNVTTSETEGVTFPYPANVAVDAQGNRYVADTNSDRILVTTAAGVTSTLAGNGHSGTADGDGRSAQFSLPSGLVMDHDGNLFVADMGNRRIRKITLPRH